MNKKPDEVTFFMVTVRRREGHKLTSDMGLLRQVMRRTGFENGVRFRIGGVLKDGVEQPRIWWWE